MHDFLIGAAASAVTGFMLWLFLPRGAVLHKQPLTHNPYTRDLVYDTWKITNESAVAVRLRSVQYYDAHTHSHPDGPWLDLTDDREDDTDRMYVRLDDEVLEMARLDARKPWPKIVVPPGDTLTVKVPLLTDVLIKYRRAGWSGMSERREVKLRGGS